MLRSLFCLCNSPFFKWNCAPISIFTQASTLVKQREGDYTFNTDPQLVSKKGKVISGGSFSTTGAPRIHRCFEDLNAGLALMARLLFSRRQSLRVDSKAYQAERPPPPLPPWAKDTHKFHFLLVLFSPWWCSLTVLALSPSSSKGQLGFHGCETH